MKMKRSEAKKIYQNNQVIQLNDTYYSKIVLANEDNFDENCSGLLKQLKAEGKYNTWINVVVSDPTKKVSIYELPVFGNSEKWVTKWFYFDKNEAVKDGLKVMKNYNLI